MTIKIYNTLSGKKEEFKPISPNKVGIYVCGPTVYDSCHIGHARAAVVFDVIVRYLRKRGYHVTYVRNYTDVDNKVINRANEEKVDFLEIADKYIKEYERDMDTLGVLPPDIAPRVSEHIPDIIESIQKLIANGHAYVSDGDVFFDVTSVPEYGKLSKRDKEQMLAGARVDINERKRNELDFALWKSAKPGEPSWDSPWGKGRPGWHIECSVMSAKYLGQPFDIHGGGVDLVFPHHENEIAQAECAEHKRFCSYWIHNGHVSTRGEKISKSLGNFIPIPQLVEKWHPEAIRIFLLAKHHSSPVDFTPEALDDAAEQLDRFYEALYAVSQLENQPKQGKDVKLESAAILEETINSFPIRFDEAMEEDFNTALALGHLHTALRALNRFLSEAKSCQYHCDLAMRAGELIKQSANILGILNEEPADYIKKKKKKALENIGLTEEEIKALIEKRQEARRQKNWGEADKIRNELMEKGIILKDGPNGTEWTVK